MFIIIAVSLDVSSIKVATMAIKGAKFIYL